MRYVERRKFGRRECSVEALVVYRDCITYSCVIRNVSARGAVIELEPGVEVPNEFELRLVSTGTQGICIVRHRTDGRVGVQFVSRALGHDLEKLHQRQLAETELPEQSAMERAHHVAPASTPVSAPALRRDVLGQSSSHVEPVSRAALASCPPVAGPSGMLEAAALVLPSSVSDAPAKPKSARQPEPLILPV